MVTRSFIRTGVLVVAAVVSAAQARSDEATLSIGAAMSLRTVMPPLMEAFRSSNKGGVVQANYGASGALRQQIEAGAPMDVAVLADAATVDALVESDRADHATRKGVASNVLVLIGPKNAKPLTFKTINNLEPGEKIAIGEPGAVPAGRYAKEAFEKLGNWDKLTGHLVYGGDVGAVLNYARRVEVAAEVVYRT